MNDPVWSIAAAWKKIAFGFVAALLLGVAPGRGAGSAAAAASPASPPRLGIAGGYFTCALPAGWSRQDDALKPGDTTYQLLLIGRRAENAPVLIFLSFYGPGNDDFKDYADFVTRNTTDSWEDKPKTEARKTTLNGRNALWWEWEEKTFLHPESKSDESVMIKEKFYVFLAKDRVGFFVLHYTAPSSVYAEHLPVFEKVASSFELL